MRARVLMSALTASIALFAAAAAATLPAAASAAAADSAKSSPSTADHSKFRALQVEFSSGPAVTKACLSCHTEASKQIHKTQHWTWEYESPEGQMLGKKHIINNYCTSATTNEGQCNSCHIGYGWKDSKFDFTSETNVDCLVCHDTTGKYQKPAGLAGDVVARDMEFPPGSGKIVRAINLKQIAQKVGKTRRETCGACHFMGGGGDGVKHGDLDSSLESPDKALDVHMDAEGNNFACATCHETVDHKVPGSRYAPTAQDKGQAHIRGKKDATNPVTCQACHGQSPHKSKSAKLNDHTRRIACQTCHIPAFARGGIPTKMSWDWSTAGQRGPDGQPLVKRNAEGHVVYNGAKGSFEMGENVVPEYVWFNGRVKYTLLGDPIEKSSAPVPVNRFEGSPNDGKSMIWPVKVFRGKQAFDPVNKTLVVTHLAGNDDSAYWTNLNWERAVAKGMSAVNAKFSGTVDFIETESTWPITHMVTTKEKALGCADCHASAGRLAKIQGIYIPGRASDHVRPLEFVGWAAASLALLGALLHGLARFAASRRRK